MPRSRFGDLPREKQKVINQLCRRRPGGGDCQMEIMNLLSCMRRHDFDTTPCTEQIVAMRACTESQAATASRLTAKMWKTGMKQRLIKTFSRAKLK
eukprot:TRINITY_DN70223_c0_g1_i1.p1 TRINITY_DN70223_c0_g1~~TRINITY_DN70223_c0_g1_i1.p1  ORF type:complete len:107 (-),score=8.31 TRINITY_DN70223_c0_g1_i1:19-306(-)